MTKTLPYGSWPSPIAASDVAAGSLRLGGGMQVDGEIWWAEGRPSEGGRQVVVRRTADGVIQDVLPSPWNARTRVHEYGGHSWLPVPSPVGFGLVFVNFADQRLYRLDAGSVEPIPLTPQPDDPCTLRFADLVLSPDETEIWAVGEEYVGNTVTRHIVAIPLDGSAAGQVEAIRKVAGGSHFFANPRISPDGRKLAWLAWNHPQMPWDGCELRVADLSEDGFAVNTQTLLGSPTEALFQPEWVNSGELYVVSDRSNWWNLYRINSSGGEPIPLCPREEEFGTPLWVLGMRMYAQLADGRLGVIHGTDEYRLGVFDPATGNLTDLDLPYTVWGPSLSADGETLIGVAGSSTLPTSLVAVNTKTGDFEVIQQAVETLPDPRYLPIPESTTVSTVDGRQVHVHIYPPRNSDCVAPDDEAPPYVVFIHGGPTAQALATLDLEKAFFTSRGIGILDVNYGGSTGYGRAYRERLRGEWGVVDVDDAVAAAQSMVDRGEADGARLAIRGGSAGGWTTLSALTKTTAFAAGTSRYGVAELLQFAADTHDFESHYMDGLIGPLPEAEQLYRDRAPLSHVDDICCPVLLLQGAEDKVVPPSQSEMFRDALARKKIPHAYVLFPGEQHGFRQAETQIAALNAELSFYGQILGFEPSGVSKLELE